MRIKKLNKFAEDILIIKLFNKIIIYIYFFFFFFFFSIYVYVFKYVTFSTAIWVTQSFNTHFQSYTQLF